MIFIFIIFVFLSGSESDGMKSIWDVRTCQLNEFLWCLSSNASNASNANTFQLKCRHIWQLNWGSSHRVRSQRRHWGDRNTSTQIFPFQTVCWCLLQTVRVTSHEEVPSCKKSSPWQSEGRTLRPRDDEMRCLRCGRRTLQLLIIGLTIRLGWGWWIGKTKPGI